MFASVLDVYSESQTGMSNTPVISSISNCSFKLWASLRCAYIPCVLDSYYFAALTSKKEDDAKLKKKEEKNRNNRYASHSLVINPT